MKFVFLDWLNLGCLETEFIALTNERRSVCWGLEECIWSFHIQNNISFCWRSKELQHNVQHTIPYYFWISLFLLDFNNCSIISVPFSSFSRTHCGSVALWIATASPTFPLSLLSTLSPSCSLLSSYLSMWSWPSSWNTWRTATRRPSWRRWRRKQRWERRRRPANASLRHLWVETWGRTWKHLRR